MEPWEFGAELAMDAGIALGRNLGNIALTADGSSKPQGLEDSIQDNSSMQIANPVKAESATTSGAEIFDTNWNYADYVPIAAALPQPYDRMMPRCLVKKSVWARSIAIITTTGAEAGVERLFDRLAPFSLNEDVEDASSEHQIPFIVLAENAMGLRLAGPMRMDFSSEFGFRNDLLSYRIAHHFDANILDLNGARGLQACLRLAATSYGHRQTPNFTLTCVALLGGLVRVDVTPPLIVWNPHRMRAEVVPIPVVYGPQGAADEQASYQVGGDSPGRTHRRLRPDGRVTGLRRLSKRPEVPSSVPDLAVDIFAYAFFVSPLMGMCRVYQTAAQNDLPVTVRTGLPTVVKEGETDSLAYHEATYDRTVAGVGGLDTAMNDSVTAVSMGANARQTVAVGDYIRIDNEDMLVGTVTNQNTFVVTRGQRGTTAAAHSNAAQVDLYLDPVVFKAYKYSYISQLAYEVVRSVDPAQLNAELVDQAGTAMAQNVGSLLMTGDGVGDPQGLRTAVNGDLNQYTIGKKGTAATTGDEVFDSDWSDNDLAIVAFLLDTEQYIARGVRTLMRASVWKRMLSEGGSSVRSHIAEATFRHAPVLFDANMQDASTQHTYPFIQLAAGTMGLRFAGPLRFESSSESGFRNDRVEYKVVQYHDSRQLDPGGAHAYRTAAN